MESRFGRDFSGVHVHDDDAAARSARDVAADAYTVGAHVVFDTGRLSPGTESGRRLLAHELAHVVQQSGGAESSASHFGIPAISCSGVSLARTPNAKDQKESPNFTASERQMLIDARAKLNPKKGAIVGVLIPEKGDPISIPSGGGQGFSSHI